MRRIAQVAGIGAAAVGLLFGSAGVASADDRGYLDDLAAHGMTYGGWMGIPSPAQAIRLGHIICDNIKYSGDPRAGFNFVSNAGVPDYLIDGAQHELCPDTL